MATAGRKSGTLVQAIRHLGQDQIDDHTLAVLRRQITDADRPAIRKDLNHAPGCPIGPPTATLPDGSQ